MSRFIRQHTKQLINNYFDSINHLPPLDKFVRSYFNNNKSIGSNERSNISQYVFNLIRYEYLLSHLTKTNPYKFKQQSEYRKSKKYNDRIIDDKIDLLNSSELYYAMQNEKLPKYLRCSQNKQLFKSMSHSLAGQNNSHINLYSSTQEDQNAAFHYNSIMNSKAPLTMRINPQKITMQEFYNKFINKYKLKINKCQYAPYGYKIIAPKNINLLETESFQQGQFEIQDQGSQLAALRVRARPGEIVLDYCGGSGGKTLAIAHLMKGKGQIFIHQPKQLALQRAKKRFQRANITNVQFHNDQSKLQHFLSGKADWVIVDAPCTGVGTIRRNPDIKLRYDQRWLRRHVLLQEQIVAKALKYLKKNGRLVYITCSLLREQNEEQIHKFLKVHQLEVQNGQFLKIMPQKDGTDGFFAVVMTKK